ncbi:MAG: 4-hydroxythreonine-4-phosphate dehydrogenase [Candidatus Synechococcus spongiarum SP3]|uniref:4-hydroxythreonine-4-phosphate dehydrogenase n=1 Tax=Candidatus Synechococcus spongiarum SP3 TaxID=1604020 RepID=A0A0G2HJ12_9SYNE|nr:MAG: 4-hydroxythreonine-4-phosphate dehydrogenase [Candidatus Synechococcus spongiarum SP3]
MDQPRRIAIALGDPAGIGAEVVLKALANRRVQQAVEPVLFGCRRWLLEQHHRLRQRGQQVVDPQDLHLVDMPLAEPVHCGQATAMGGAASFTWLTAACRAVLTGQCQALTTAPIAKHCWQAAGHAYLGQTERLAQLAGGVKVSMLFTARSPQKDWRLNTLLATTHIPFQQVVRNLSPTLVQRQLTVLEHFCRQYRGQPVLKVAGLNPHAGEAGHLGTEECDWLEPCLKAWQALHPGCTVLGPEPPDTCWLDAGQAWRGHGRAADGYLALYHDQGLIPTKLIAFDEAVNTTLGLPFIRTSPDHGTAFSLAGQGLAREGSMVAALLAAAELRPLSTLQDC